MSNIIRILSTTACGVAGFLWGELDGLLIALLAFMAFDYLTGVVAAFKYRELSSNTGFIGLARKGLILVVVAIGHILDTQVLGGGSSFFRSALIGFYLANEGLSILENAGRLGVPLPVFLREALRQLKEKNDNPHKEGEKNETL